MSTVNKVKSVVKEVVALLQGDTSKVIGQRIYRKSDSALTFQIAGEKYKLMGVEEKLDAAKEAKRLARINNGKEIADGEEYVSNLLKAENNITLAQAELDALNKKIKFLESELEAVNTEEVDTEA